MVAMKRKRSGQEYDEDEKLRHQVGPRRVIVDCLAHTRLPMATPQAHSHYR